VRLVGLRFSPTTHDARRPIGQVHNLAVILAL
jgi:hypothetical protein